MKKVLEVINFFHQKSDLPILANTSVVSPLYPGQFCYCLDEIHWYKKYGNFINIEAGDNFQKIQPAIRLRDFESFYPRSSDRLQHLGLFTLSTITGGKVVSKEDSLNCFRTTVKNFLDFFSFLGLNQKRLRITYFSGNTAGKIEMSRKKEVQERRILVDTFIPEDNFRHTFLEYGLEEEQLIGINTRDNYLTLNWYHCVAPWGYRNEILYQMPDGNYLDLGTIERLEKEPTIEERNGKNYAVAIKDWDRNIVIDSIGVERVMMAIEEKSSISDIALLTPLKNLLQKSNLSTTDIDKSCEALRMLHRIFTDSARNDLSRQKKERVNFLMRSCKNVSVDLITDFLDLHAKQYGPLFTDLAIGAKRTIKEIKEYRQRV